jgi:hypothetical protein
MRDIVHAVITIGGGKKLDGKELESITADVHNVLADAPELQKSYGRSGYAIVVEIARD